MTERFELLTQLGKGGMGVVWKARDRRSGEVVALKLVHSLYADDPQYLARFEREVDMGRSIDSPYVVKVLGYGRQDGKPYIAMEYVDGPSLRELLEEKGKLSWQEAQPMVAQVWAGLAAAHAVNVIHRDVKPSNILIAADGAAKLADFGIARSLEATRLTGSSTMLGTPYYMAPDRTMTQASDLYALGCVLYEMLTGTPPFGGDTPQEVLLQHVREEADLRHVPAPARPLVEALLTKEPGVRTARAVPLLDALDLPLPPPERPAPAPPPPQRPDWPRWPVALAGGGFLAVVGSVVGLAIAMSGGNDDGTNDKASGSNSTPATQTDTPTATRPSPSPSATMPTPPPTSTLTATATATALPPTATPVRPTPATATPAAGASTTVSGLTVTAVDCSIQQNLCGAGYGDWNFDIRWTPQSSGYVHVQQAMDGANRGEVYIDLEAGLGRKFGAAFGMVPGAHRWCFRAVHTENPIRGTSTFLDFGGALEQCVAIVVRSPSPAPSSPPSGGTPKPTNPPTP